jgi:hypothetical protein
MLTGSARILEILVAHRVRFTIVGGLAAVLHGSSSVTRDVDVVYALDDNNVDRMLAALAELNARFRQRPDLVPQRSHIAARGHKLLQTDHGELDALGFAGNNHEYPELANWSSPMQIGPIEVLVLNLPAQIRIKEETGRPKDLLMLPILRSLHREVSADPYKRDDADE